jgi:hypothetical protein
LEVHGSIPVINLLFLRTNTFFTDAFVCNDFLKSKFRKKIFYTKLNSEIKEYTYCKKQPEAMREKFYTTNLPSEAKRQYPLSCKFTAGVNITQPLPCKFTAGGHV